MKNGESITENPLFDEYFKENNNNDILIVSNDNNDKSKEQSQGNNYGNLTEVLFEEESNNFLHDKLVSQKENGNNDTNFLNEDEYDNIPNEKIIKYDPYLESNFISRYFFLWAFNILKLSKKYYLRINDLGNPSSFNNAINYSKIIHKIWNDHKNLKNNSLLLTIIKANSGLVILIIIFCLLQAGIDYFSVIITKQFIDYFDKKNLGENSKFVINIPLWGMGLLFLGTQFLYTFINLYIQMIQTNFAIKAGNELNCLIYEKILNYSPSNFTNKVNHGEIINFIQIDSLRLLFLFTIAPIAFASPFMICIYIYLLIDFFGLYIIPGLIAMLIFLYINFYLGSLFIISQKDSMLKKDLCMKITTETFENIKIFKLYNLENEFKKKILDSRKIEMDYFDKSFMIKTYMRVLNWFIPIIMSVSIIGMYVIFNNAFDITVILIGLSIFSKILIPIKSFPALINSFLEINISLKRIENFLKQYEIKKGNIHYEKDVNYAIKITNGNFSWGVKKKENNCKIQTLNKINNDFPWVLPKIDENFTKKKNGSINTYNLGNEEEKAIIREEFKIQINIPKDIDFDINLKNINLEIKKGELIAIVGEVGSGKSSLLEAIINSLILLNPKECDGIHINGRIGYVPQLPWIQNETIRNNIIFSKSFDSKKYTMVLELCELIDDLKFFEGKDLTEIGEKGINLSGGQKMRISLARAIYNDPDIYLFDNPLSSLDANIGKKIMENCILKFLKGKTRIFVTNTLNYLENMDRIIYMKSGKIEWTGNFEDFQKESFFTKLMKIRKYSCDFKENIDEFYFNKKDSKHISMEESGQIIKLVKDEEQGHEEIELEIYRDYIIYIGGICFMSLIVILMLLTQMTKGGSDLWLAFWTEEKNQVQIKKFPNSKWNFYGIYSLFGLGTFTFIFIRMFLFSKGIIRLERLLHKDMIEKLIKAPINLFHEIIPRGQIYNRLSKDLDNIIETMYDLSDLIISFFYVVCSFALCGIYDFYSLLFMPFIFAIGIYITRFFLKGSRPIRRMASISSSPILNIISETLSGISTIRAFKDEKFYKSKYLEKINNSLNINLINKGTILWFQEQFKFISIIYLTYLIVKVILYEENLTSQSCSIIFTYSYILQYHLGNIFYYYGCLENDMISMERCCKYKKIIQENRSDINEEDKKLINDNWPQNGEIKFDNYSVRYRPGTNLVLKNLEIQIQPGSKIGVCGRTGSGKSTICLCLFRILEASEGRIFIDNVDISTVGLDLLRNSITIIPQDPCLVEGTLRYNIDPLNKSSDDDIMKILYDIGFVPYESNKNILNTIVELGGSNLSVGQKQLICIARAILRKSKIVVMDEATANIDMKTEKIIQNALRLAFSGSTVITVAHRIKTIEKYDRILVLDEGKVIEYDSPAYLLKNKNSLFYELYTKSSL